MDSGVKKYTILEISKLEVQVNCNSKSEIGQVAIQTSLCYVSQAAPLFQNVLLQSFVVSD